MPVYVEAIAPHLPEELAVQVEALTQGSTEILEACIRFVLGAPCAVNFPHDPESWRLKQQQARERLDSLVPAAELKRSREGGDDQPQDTKRPKLTAQNDLSSADRGSPIFTLHSISVTSPIRKKVDIVISPTSITLENPTSKAVEATVPLSTLTRAFLLPTRGKQKPHWTVVLLPADAPNVGKGSGTSPANQQIIFGIDATSTGPFQTTAYSSSAEPTVVAKGKGTATLPALRTFLSHLPIPLYEPNTQHFRSATGGSGPEGNGVPGIEAYRGAKQGSLWFLEEGILWGESKPCEFWPLDDLINRTEGLRIIGGAGRTCTVVLTRRQAPAEGEAEEDVEGVEAEFGVIDAREQDPINQWVRQYRHLFGNGAAEPAGPAEGSRPPQVAGGKSTFAQMQFGSDDESDASFASDNESHDGSSANSDDDEGSEQPQDDDAEGEAESEDDGEASGMDEDEGELKPENHPLLRPGAMPRMSRAAINMVVNMVEEDLMGKDPESEDSEGEDELAD
ncbi:hypothetical protein HGRIS_007036 [Hohenbuehelia grisea]|uniref:Histone chaperone RTT106/FACT complex subunit SPT16-like middle domain-containing protein n=1 Tax=Hohenbuehelia grisea TaxID=104357 RepID=A0ABR3JC02_9AGAR